MENKKMIFETVGDLKTKNKTVKKQKTKVEDNKTKEFKTRPGTIKIENSVASYSPNIYLEEIEKTTPNRYKNAKWEDIHKNTKEAIQKIYTKKTKKTGLYIFGPAGTGKTHTVLAIRKKLATSLIACEYLKTYNVLEELRDFESIEKKYTINDIVHYPGTLILDDFGLDKTTDWAYVTLFRIVDGRYDNNLKTIFTSNLSINELAKQYGDRTSSRILESCYMFEMSGNDHRQDQELTT